jgi:hypothetical protein
MKNVRLNSGPTYKSILRVKQDLGALSEQYQDEIFELLENIEDKTIS